MQVFDAERTEWVDFPHPMLTPPRDFEAPYDWLPAVLESVLLAVAKSHEPPVMASLRPYRVLRRIYDASAESVAGGMLRGDISGHRALVEWLAGRSVGGGSAVAGAAEATTVDDRADLAAGWLSDIRSLAGVHYMGPGQRIDGEPVPAAGGGVFSVVNTRELASRTPMWRDIAPDAYWAAGRLTELVETCRKEALTPVAMQMETVWPAAEGDDIVIPPGPGQSSF